MPPQLTQGPTESVVAENITRLRVAQRYNFHQLARELASVGVPIPVLSLRKIETGDRRIMIDHMMAFARVFEVHLSELLLGPDIPGSMVRVTGFDKPVEPAGARDLLGLRQPDVVVRFTADDIERMSSDPQTVSDLVRRKLFISFAAEAKDGEA